MMRKFLSILLLLIVASCGTGKKSKTSKKQARTISVAAANDARKGVTANKPVKSEITSTPSEYVTEADKIINTALTFSGVRYKFGGTTKRGMDCSGLLYVSFGKHDIKLPRTSIHMAEEGKKIKVKNVAKGDLLFFKTNKRAKRINHVGMVVDVSNDDVKFIHASSSRGVTVSSLRDGFWNSAFVKATRIL
ncbi:C40 family peptidase [Maribacter sp. 2210JD10-5]|uniref:C40 family peptidase n=1 Tax=Maribacter sp. 2210JD10-5 TaxID=3386272 RepID=UPI0039BD2B1B